MVGLPSGLERVRWKQSAISPQPSITPRIFAPRACAASRLSSTSAPAPSAITKPSRFFENGFEARLRRIVRGRERREQREADQRLGVHRAVGADAERRSVSPRRIASTPSWIAVAPEAQAVESEIGEPLVPNFSAIRSATEPNRKRS